MVQTTVRQVSRRAWLQTMGTGALLAGFAPAVLGVRCARAQPKTLKILQWNHFVPAYDTWFNETYVPAWGVQHNTRVIVDNIGYAGLTSRADAEVVARKGHDLVQFLWPPPKYEDDVLDHREIYEECARQYGPAIPLAIKSTYNPTTRKYFGFAHSYAPDPVNYRKDLWDLVSLSPPETWDDIRRGGAMIRQTQQIPVGIGLASEPDSNMALRAILHSFGGAEQNADGQPALKSRATLEAIKFVKALYQEAMLDAVFTWDASSNNRLMLAGRGSLVMNAISITRTGEQEPQQVTDDIWLARAAQGPAGRLSLPHATHVSVIWKFAENIAGAQQFLVDYVRHFRQAFIASKYFNFPCFPTTVPDLPRLLAHADAPQVRPPEKYHVLSDNLAWTTNVGHPGYCNAAIHDIMDTWVLPRMFAQAASGLCTPEAALDQADQAVKRRFSAWKARGKV